MSYFATEPDHITEIRRQLQRFVDGPPATFMVAIRIGNEIGDRKASVSRGKSVIEFDCLQECYQLFNGLVIAPQYE